MNSEIDSLNGTLNMSSFDQESYPYVFIDYRMEAVNLYICPMIGIIGFILNTLCCFIFSFKDFQELLYKYIKMVNLFIALNLLLASMRPIYFNKSNWFSKSYFAKFYLAYGLDFTSSILEMASIICQIYSTLTFYLLVSNLFQKYKYARFIIYYKINCFFIMLFSVLIYSYKLFTQYIYAYLVPIEENNYIELKLHHSILYTEFNKSTIKKVIEICVFLLRDFILLVLLTGLEFLIYKQVKRSIQSKKSIMLAANSTRKTNKKLQNMQHRITLMVIINGINFIFGRIPILIYFVLVNLVGNSNHVMIFLNFAIVAVYTSYAVNFFIYYFCNLKFRKVFRLFLLQIMQKFNLILKLRQTFNESAK